MLFAVIILIPAGIFNITQSGHVELGVVCLFLGITKLALARLARDSYNAMDYGAIFFMIMWSLFFPLMFFL